MCRLCHEYEVLIQHILSTCPVLAPTSYLGRHNVMDRVLHWHLCRFFTAGSWYGDHPFPISENGNAKLLWDFGVVTDHHVESNRPDVVLFYKQEKRIIFFEISCPADINVVSKEQEKVPSTCLGNILLL